MFFVLLILIAVQYYWSQRVFEINREYFRYGVNIAISKTVDEIDTKATTYRNELFAMHQDRVFRIIDSLGTKIYQIKEQYPYIESEYGSYWDNVYKAYLRNSELYDKDEEAFLNMLDEQEQVYFKQRTDGKGDSAAGEVSIRDFIQFLAEQKVISNSPQQRHVKKQYENLVHERDEIIKNNERIESVIKENLDKLSHVELMEVIGSTYIDSILTQSLSEVNINIPFSWQIYREDIGKVIHRNDSTDFRVLAKNDAEIYEVSLFHDYSYYLCVYFPAQDNFLISRIWILVFASIILIASAVFVFSYTIYSMSRQRKVNELRNDFVNHVTHELKTPVSTISLICDSYFDSEEKEQNKEITDEYFSIVRTENGRLQSLIQQIFDISRIDKNEYPVFKTKFSLKDAVSEAVNNLSYQLENKNTKIITDFSVADDMIESDRVHIVRIISNLIDNANKYSRGSKPLIKISVRAVTKGLMVDVKDNGIGISRKEQKEIFKTLYRVSSGNIHNVKGFGLGLSYVKSMLATLGGRITLDSEQGKGSCFHVFIPK